MNTTKALMIFFIAGSLAACNSANLGEKAETGEAVEVKQVEGEKVVYAVNPQTSVINWKGSKPTKVHHGTIDVKNGELEVKNGEIVGGKFAIDMKSIVNHDIEDEEWNTKLVGHLHSDDFFSTETYPEATFEISSVKPYTGETVEGEVTPTHVITGNLTIKGITKSISFNAMVNSDGNNIVAESVPFTVDRAEWDVRYQSKKFFDDLKDDFIHDDIGIQIKINSSATS
ncbi:MAG: YceI family protein [Bacteroidales bacterium]|nr:YceI family protein [Bacteroidales bacterium]